MLEQFKDNTWGAIRWTLENSGPLTYRDVIYRFYKTPNGYFDIDPDEPAVTSARKLFNRHKGEYKFKAFPDYVRERNVKYFFAKHKDLPDSPFQVVHDNLIQTVFFALDRAYGDGLTSWTTDEDDCRFTIETKDGDKSRTADAKAIVGDRTLLIELEKTQKNLEKIIPILKRYRAALKQGKIPQNCYIIYITPTVGLRDSIKELATKFHLPEENTQFCTIRDFLVDPKADIYV